MFFAISHVFFRTSRNAFIPTLIFVPFERAFFRTSGKVWKIHRNIFSVPLLPLI